MHTGTLNIREIFGQDKRLMVPLFQRPYVWKREQQWEPLWEDIRAIAERILQDKPVRPHFLGAIVLDQMPHPTGRLEKRLIIDGQQRLATIQILLEAFADICATVGAEAEKYHRALLQLTRNYAYLSNDPDDKYKVWPTNVDQEQFRQVMQAGSPDQLALHALPSIHLIADSYLFFHHSILDWLVPTEPGFGKRRDVLYDVLCDYVRMVVIDLGHEDDAQLIFETLNARGTPLLPSELVKNFLLRRATLEDGDIEQLYKQYWQPFDSNASYWRHELGPGHAKRARIDLYLQHYLTLKKRDEVPVAHLYTAFREYASNGDEASIHLKSLHQYAKVYQSFDTVDRNTREGLFFRRLGQMDITTAYPFLLELFTRYGGQNAQVSKVLVDIESFLVRRMVCQLPTRGYNRLFIDLLKTLDGPAEELPDRVRTVLLSADAESTRWPKDSEFRRAWLDAPLYNRLRLERIRMLLEALELQLYTGLTEKIKVEGVLTIEHLLPQAWYQHWPLPTDVPREDAEEHRNTLLHTLGNLTLLTEKLNPKLSNGPWENKRRDILRHSALALNRPLEDYHEWNEDAIMQRSEELFKAAQQAWPFPQA